MSTQCTCPSCGARLTITTTDRMDRPHEAQRPQQAAGPRPERQPPPMNAGEAARYAMPFGCHAGRTLAEIDRDDPDYLAWGLANFDRVVGRAVALYLGSKQQARHEQPRAAPGDRRAALVAELAEAGGYDQADDAGDDIAY